MEIFCRAENIFYPGTHILKKRLLRYCLKIQRRTATDDTKNRNTLQFYFAIIKKICIFASKIATC